MTDKKDNKEEEEKGKSENGFAAWPLRAVQGALVGGGAILPGVSGGVLCVAFGIYRPMMELLSHPAKAFREYYKLFIPFIIGWLAGFWGLARLMELLFSASSAAAVCLFAALVAGTLPSLFSEAGKEGVSRAAFTAFALTAFAMYALLSFLKNGAAASISPNAGWYVFCGAVWGLSLVIPGLSSSSVLIFLGLYEPMTAGISALDFRVILPLVAGIAVTVILLARAVNALFERFYSVTYFGVIGVVLSSTLLILPESFSSAAEAGLCAVIFCGGFAAAYFMNCKKG